MKKSRFTDSQIAEALKRVEAGLSVPELCRELGFSSATFYKWRATPQGSLAAKKPDRITQIDQLVKFG
jgi:putative transposase